NYSFDNGAPIYGNSYLNRNNVSGGAVSSITKNGFYGQPHEEPIGLNAFTSNVETSQPLYSSYNTKIINGGFIGGVYEPMGVSFEGGAVGEGIIRNVSESERIGLGASPSFVLKSSSARGRYDIGNNPPFMTPLLSGSNDISGDMSMVGGGYTEDGLERTSMRRRGAGVMNDLSPTFGRTIDDYPSFLISSPNTMSGVKTDIFRPVSSFGTWNNRMSSYDTTFNGGDVATHTIQTHAPSIINEGAEVGQMRRTDASSVAFNSVYSNDFKSNGLVNRTLSNTSGSFVDENNTETSVYNTLSPFSSKVNTPVYNSEYDTNRSINPVQNNVMSDNTIYGGNANKSSQTSVGGKVELNLTGKIELTGGGQTVDITNLLRNDPFFVRRMTEMIVNQIGVNQNGGRTEMYRNRWASTS
ncbi:MAG: hypothetical protein J6Y37_04185, partial [Paludibacteraceae bacterium]|nr:hypothetical protein [Paludibacteraceae bacterium]